MSEPVLKPCPFCGAPAEMRRPHGEYFVQCTRLGNCYGAYNSFKHEGYLYEKDAIELWNRRDESALREARIEGMRMARDACSLVFDESAIQRLIDEERK